MRVYLLMLVLFLASVPGSGSSQGHKEESENDIREIVLLYMFEHEAQQQKPYTKVLFISAQKKDPDDKFIARLKGHIPPVSPSRSSLTVISPTPGSKLTRGALLEGIGSFPSGHEIAAFSVATVFADRYPI